MEINAVTTLWPSKGFHFDLTTDIIISEEWSHCPPYLLYTFPSSVLVDKYELRDGTFDFVLDGETDLEVPAVASRDEFSLRIRPRSTQVILPLHARYPTPGNAELYSSIFLHAPTLYGNSCLPQANVHDPPSVHSTLYEVKVPRGNLNHRTLVEVGTSVIVWMATAYLLFVMWWSLSQSKGEYKKCLTNR